MPKPSEFTKSKWEDKRNLTKMIDALIETIETNKSELSRYPYPKNLATTDDWIDLGEESFTSYTLASYVSEMDTMIRELMALKNEIDNITVKQKQTTAQKLLKGVAENFGWKPDKTFDLSGVCKKFLEITSNHEKSHTNILNFLKELYRGMKEKIIVNSVEFQVRPEKWENIFKEQIDLEQYKAVFEIYEDSERLATQQNNLLKATSTILTSLESVKTRLDPEQKQQITTLQARFKSFRQDDLNAIHEEATALINSARESLILKTQALIDSLTPDMKKFLTKEEKTETEKEVDFSKMSLEEAIKVFDKRTVLITHVTNRIKMIESLKPRLTSDELKDMEKTIENEGVLTAINQAHGDIAARSVEARSTKDYRDHLAEGRPASENSASRKKPDSPHL